MKTAGYVAILISLCGPALAHSGAHLHPHGVEIPWAVGLAAIAIAAATALILHRK